MKLTDIQPRMAILPKEKRTCFANNGDAHIAIITEQMASLIECQVGEVRLLKGIEGRTGGFGLRILKVTQEGKSS